MVSREYKQMPDAVVRKSWNGSHNSPQAKVKKAVEKLHERFPVILENLVASGLGTKMIRCPSCKRRFKIDIPKDTQVLIHLDNRVQGKPMQKTELDIAGSIEFSSEQLRALLNRVVAFQESYAKEDIQIVEAEIKEITNPLLLESGHDAAHDAPRSGVSNTSIPGNNSVDNKQTISNNNANNTNSILFNTTPAPAREDVETDEPAEILRKLQKCNPFHETTGGDKEVEITRFD
jgi:hypothetical protein